MVKKAKAKTYLLEAETQWGLFLAHQASTVEFPFTIFDLLFMCVLINVYNENLHI